LNGFSEEGEDDGVGKDGAEYRGSVSSHHLALGDHTGLGTILEGRGNAGMSVLVPLWPTPTCDSTTFLCQNLAPVRMERLDNLLAEEEGPICLTKVDAEGSELKILRGAKDLMHKRVLPLIHLEWWPPHLRSVGENPLSLLWYLHSLDYELYVQARVDSKNKDDRQWLRVVPSQFHKLLGRWGDLVAKLKMRAN